MFITRIDPYILFYTPQKEGTEHLFVDAQILNFPF
jgi:hypothetical protein